MQSELLVNLLVLIVYLVFRRDYGEEKSMKDIDGSTDGSGEVCDLYKKNDSRINVIHQKNEGPSKSRNNGLDIATGNM